MSKAIKLSYYSVDDQPNYKKRDRHDQGTSIFCIQDDISSETEDAIVKKWKSKKRKNKKKDSEDRN